MQVHVKNAFLFLQTMMHNPFALLSNPLFTSFECFMPYARDPFTFQCREKQLPVYMCPNCFSTETPIEDGRLRWITFHCCTLEQRLEAPKRPSLDRNLMSYFGSYMGTSGLGCWALHVPRKDFDDFLTELKLPTFSSFVDFDSW